MKLKIFQIARMGSTKSTMQCRAYNWIAAQGDKLRKTIGINYRVVPSNFPTEWDKQIQNVPCLHLCIYIDWGTRKNVIFHLCAVTTKMVHMIAPVLRQSFAVFLQIKYIIFSKSLTKILMSDKSQNTVRKMIGSLLNPYSFFPQFEINEVE